MARKDSPPPLQRRSERNGSHSGDVVPAPAVAEFSEPASPVADVVASVVRRRAYRPDYSGMTVRTTTRIDSDVRYTLEFVMADTGLSLAQLTEVALRRLLDDMKVAVRAVPPDYKFRR